MPDYRVQRHAGVDSRIGPPKFVVAASHKAAAEKVCEELLSDRGPPDAVRAVVSEARIPPGLPETFYSIVEGSRTT
jgi:hypothetical protein